MVSYSWLLIIMPFPGAKDYAALSEHYISPASPVYRIKLSAGDNDGVRELLFLYLPIGCLKFRVLPATCILHTGRWLIK